MADNKLHQKMNVSEDPVKNKRLDDEQRRENIEADIVTLCEGFQKLAMQNDRYAEYIDSEIAAKKEKHEFWLDVKKKLATSTIWGAVLLIFTALSFAAKEWLNK